MAEVTASKFFEEPSKKQENQIDEDELITFRVEDAHLSLTKRKLQSIPFINNLIECSKERDEPLVLNLDLQVFNKIIHMVNSNFTSIPNHETFQQDQDLLRMIDYLCIEIPSITVPTSRGRFDCCSLNSKEAITWKICRMPWVQSLGFVVSGPGALYFNDVLWGSTHYLDYFPSEKFMVIRSPSKAPWCSSKPPYVIAGGDDMMCTFQEMLGVSQEPIEKHFRVTKYPYGFTSAEDLEFGFPPAIFTPSKINKREC